MADRNGQASFSDAYLLYIKEYILPNAPVARRGESNGWYYGGTDLHALKLNFESTNTNTTTPPSVSRPSDTTSTTTPTSPNQNTTTTPSTTPSSNLDEGTRNQICQLLTIISVLGIAEQDDINRAITLFSCNTSVTLPSSTISTPRITITANLYPGISHPQVVQLRNFLRTNGYLNHSSNTDFYDSFVTEAVRKFQRENNIVSSGTPETTGYGLIGPRTRNAINGYK